MGLKKRDILYFAVFMMLVFGSAGLIAGLGMNQSGKNDAESGSVTPGSEERAVENDRGTAEDGLYYTSYGDSYETEFQRDSAEREKEYQEKTVADQQETLVQDQGLYAPDSIVLQNTTKAEAERIAEKLGAKVRLTAKEDFAVLYLPEGMTIDDVYADKELAVDVMKMSPDYFIATNEISSWGRKTTSNDLSSLMSGAPNSSTELSSVLRDTSVFSNDDGSSLHGDEEESLAPRLSIRKSRPSYSGNDTWFGNQQYLDYIDLQDTWSYTKGAGVTVAVIDSGIDIDHPEFAGKISEYSYYASQDKVVKDYDMSIIDDEFGHGTVVAGVIAAAMDNGEGITGIAPDVTLLVIKCDVNEAGDFARGSDIIFGLAYAIEQNVDIINMSLASDGDIFSKYTKLAVDSDIICIASAGNDGSNVPVYPASLDSVIGVGAYDTENDTVTDYSNYGENVDILAPGNAFTTTMTGGYGAATGTSISCPIATAAAALYISQNGKVSFDKMLQLFRASSIDVGILGADYRHGYGELDIHALVCEEKGTITYDMLTDEIPNETQIFVRGRTVQYMPEPERNYVVYDGWFFDPNCTAECELYTNIFNEDVTLYANWINEDEGTVFTYVTKDDGTIDIRSYTGKRRYISVPATIEGKNVTSIGEWAFGNNTRIRSVELPKTLTSIGDWAFMGCTSLLNIDIPDSVSAIGTQAFSGCTRLAEVFIGTGSKLVSVKEKAFEFCGINSFYFPSNLVELGGCPFYGSKSLRNISVAKGNSAFQIKNSALYDSEGTTLLYYPAALSGEYIVDADTESIGNAAFAYSRSVYVNLNAGLRKIGNDSFKYSRVERVEFPVSLEMLGDYAYSNANRLSSVGFVMNGALNIISDYAFEGTYALKSVSIPACVSEIGENAFCGSGLTSVIFENTGELSLIGTGAFSWTSLRKVEIPDSVLTIKGCAFSNCWQLSEVTFGENSQCSSVLYTAFAYDVNLKTISLPDSLTLLGDQAFYESGLISITIGAGLTDIGRGAFSSCRGLSEINISATNPKYASYNGVLYTKDQTTLLIFPAGRSGEYTLPATVTRIENFGFSGADKLSSITLNEGLTEIGENAFEYCRKLQTPSLPSTLTEIGSYSFMYCEGMTDSLLIPKKTQHIGYLAFFYDYNLTDIDFEPESEMDRFGYGAFGYCGIEDFTIPRNISTMGQEMFVGCNKLLAVTFESESQLTYLPAWSFNGADNLRRITFEDESELTHIEARACESLTKLEMVDLAGCTKLKEIDNYAFRVCVSLNNMTLPKTVESIGRFAFYGCSGMSELRLPETVKHIGSYAFEKTNSINLYFAAAVLPVNLEENWDAGVGAYYVGVEHVQENDDWIYAITADGKVSVIKYKGSATDVVLDKIEGHNVVSIGGEAFLNNVTIEAITLPDTITGIYKAAFKGTVALRSIVIPANVRVIESEAFSGSGISEITFALGSELTSIGANAFENTKNLTSISLPDGVTQIREKTFISSGIKTITFSDSITSIGRLAFADSGLESIVIPASVKDISYHAFKNTKNMTAVSFAASALDGLMIRDEAFYNSGLLTVSIPAYVNYIGNLVFSNCQSLTEIVVDEGNAYYASLDGVLYDKSMSRLITCPAGKIGSYTIAKNVAAFAFGAFEGSKLSEITIPDESTLITIGHRTFYGCDILTSINIPDSVQSIEYYAFAYCDNLESVNINPTSQLSGIYRGAFYNCEKLSHILIPDSVLEISDYAFYSCSSLREVTISAGSKLQGVYDHAFEYSGIEYFSMPGEMLEIGEYAFHGTNLKSVEFNDVLMVIEKYAFCDAGLTEMEVFHVPESVEYIGENVLRGVYTIKELILPFLGPNRDCHMSAKLNHLYGLDDSSSEVWEKTTALKKVSILGGNSIGDWAFESFHMEELVIPHGITEFGVGAFARCDIVAIDLPEDIDTITKYMFYQSDSLVKIEIPEGCRMIDTQAFMYCGSLKEVIIPASVSCIAEQVFVECPSLEVINVDSKNREYKSVSGVLYNYAGTELICAPRMVSGDIILPDGLKNIGDGAFNSCLAVESVLMPDTVEYIGDYAFAGCRNLKNVIWSENLKGLGEEAFANTGLEEIVLPDKVESVGNQVFISCRQLQRVILPDSLKVLSWDMFNYCDNLTDVVLGDDVSEIGRQCFYGCLKLKEVVLPRGLQIIGRDAFCMCYALTGIYVPESVRTIEDGVFSGCRSLELIEVSEKNQYYSSFDGILYDKDRSKIIVAPAALSGTVVIPEGIKKIERKAFFGNDNLEGIILPETVEEIGDEAFADCDRLSRVSFGKNIRKIGSFILRHTSYSHSSDNIEGGVLYVGEYAIEMPFQKYDSCGALRDVNPIRDVRLREGTVLIAGRSINSYVESLYMPDSVIYINSEAAYGGRVLKRVRWSPNIREIGYEAFRGQTSLKMINIDNMDLATESVSFCECHLDYVKTNSNTPAELNANGEIITYVGAFDQNKIGAEAHNVVLNNAEQVLNSYFPMDGLKIYTRTEKDFGGFDDFEIEGNDIYYQGEWNLSTFYVDDMIVSMLPYQLSEIVHEPSGRAVKEYLPYGATLLGWDIDGDGKVDELPTTLTKDLEAVAVYSAPVSSVYLESDLYNYAYDENNQEIINEDGSHKYESCISYCKVGETRKIEYSFYPQLHTQDDTLIWTSSDENSIIVDQNGVITVLDVSASGYVTVRATLAANPQIYFEVKFYVSPREYGIKFDNTTVDIKVGDTYALNPDVVIPDDYQVNMSYVSGAEEIATVDENGIITAVSPGYADITIWCGESYSTTIMVHVTQPMIGVTLADINGIVNVGETLKLKPMYEPENTTESKSVFWYSKDSSIAKVKSDGTIFGVVPGKTEIVGVVGEFKVTFTVTVKAPLERIVLNTTKGTLRLDHTKQLDVIYIPSNTTDVRDVVWSSADDSIASVDENGLVTGLKNGKTVITGTVGAGTDNEKSATYTVSVIGLRDEATGITVTNSDDTEMQEGTSLVVEEVDDETAVQQYGDYKNAIILKIVDKHGRIYLIYIYDISLYRDSSTVQPDGYVDVEIPFPSGLLKKGGYVYRMEEDGTFTDMETTYRNGHFYFKTNHFSVYCLVVPTEEFEAAEVQIEDAEAELCIGKTAQITAIVLPEEAENRSLTYESNDQTVATVDEEGLITAVAEGTATITVKSAVDGVEGTVAVTVNKHSVVIDAAVAATCTETGLTKGSHCSVCNEVVKAQKIIPAKGHTEVKDVAVVATCTEPGLTEGSHCSVCNEVLVAQEVVPALGHKPVVDKAVAATYTETGLTEGSHCSVCGEILNAQEVVPMLVKNGVFREDGVVNYYINGEKQTGWVKYGGKMYYFDPVKGRLSGVQLIDGKCFYFSTKGVMQTGWVKYGGKMYYFDPELGRISGWKKIDGIYYRFSTKGVMMTGWTTYKEKTYYLKEDGSMATGWLEIDGVYYRFNTKGAMLTGWTKDKDDGKWYYLDESGALVTGWLQLEEKWYYLGSNGAMVIGWKKIGGKYYRFNSNGVMMTGWTTSKQKQYYLTEDGFMATGWRKIEGIYYRFNSSGVMMTGWTEYKGNTYYLTESGAMAKSCTLTIDGVDYTFSKSGVCQNP